MHWNEMHGVLQKMRLNEYKGSQVQLETLCTSSSHLKEKTIFFFNTEQLKKLVSTAES